MEFPLATIPTATTVVLYGITALLVAIALLFVWISWSSSAASVVIEEGALRVAVPIYGRSIAISQLDLQRGEVVELSSASELRPRLRTNGIGLPGYNVGWFRLKNGSKALLAVTSRQDVLHLPTREGYSLLVSARDAHRVLQTLRAQSNP